MFASSVKTCALGTLLLGCATAKPTGSEAELTRTVMSLRAQNTAYARKLEELENQVFVLQAELDSRRAGAPPPAAPPPPPVLPETKLRPGKETPQPEPGEGPESLVSEAVVEYAGAAAAPTAGKRPMLRLWGSGEGEGAGDAPPEPAPRPFGRPASAARTERVGEAAAVPPHAPTTTRANVGDGNGNGVALYQSAHDHLRAGGFEEAVAAFRAFVKRYPGHELADNAQYWLGECYYHRKDYSTALREFRRVIEKFPRGNKAPDALLKLGFTYLALGSNRPGREALGELTRTYPQHPAAGLAAAKLAELGQMARQDERKETH